MNSHMVELNTTGISIGCGWVQSRELKELPLLYILHVTLVNNNNW